MTARNNANETNAQMQLKFAQIWFFSWLLNVYFISKKRNNFTFNANI